MQQGVETRASSPTTSAMRHHSSSGKRKISDINGNGYFDGHIINVFESDDEVAPAKIPAKLPRTSICSIDE